MLDEPHVALKTDLEDLNIYTQCNGKSSKSFKQGTNIVDLGFQKDLSKYRMDGSEAKVADKKQQATTEVLH